MNSVEIRVQSRSKCKVWQLSEGENRWWKSESAFRGAECSSGRADLGFSAVETEKLLASVEAMARNNLAIVPFITHKLPIVLAISDRVTVLRRGKVVSCIRTEHATEKSLAMEMVGREVIFRIERTKVEKGKTILQVENLTAFSEKGFLALKGASFSICEGEIFGIAGISGNGQQELVEVLAGLRKAEGGKVLLDGKESRKPPAWSDGNWGWVISSDRNEVGSIADSHWWKIPL
jgi:simple sugar transport system ATP-binding protein